MAGRPPPGFRRRSQPVNAVLALPSGSGSPSRRGSQASVAGPARATPPSSPEQQVQEEGQDSSLERVYAMWDDIPVAPSQEHVEPHFPPREAHPTSPYTPATWSTSPGVPVTPPEYPPPPPLAYEEALQWTETIARDSRRVADAASGLNYSAQQFAQAMRNTRTHDWEAGPSAPAGTQRRQRGQGTRGTRRQGHSGSMGD